MAKKTKTAKEELFLGERHPDSGRQCTFEDNGTSAWMYLSEIGNATVIAYAWVYNRVAPPPVSKVESFRPNPPPAAKGYAAPEAICKNPALFEWKIFWSTDGHSVAMLRDGLPIAMITRGTPPGFSRFLVAPGPWGQLWNEKLFRVVFGKKTQSRRKSN